MNFTNPIDPCEERPEDRLAVAGIVIPAAASIAFGFALQKRSFTADRRMLTWMFGLFWIAGGFALYLAAYAYAPEIFVGPLFTIVNLFSLVFARIVTPTEHVDLNISIYVSFITIGCLLTAISGNVCAPRMANPEMVALWVFTIPYWLITFALVGVVVKAQRAITEDQIHTQAFQSKLVYYRVAYPLLASFLLSYAAVITRTIVVHTQFYPLFLIIAFVLVPATLIVLNLANSSPIFEFIVIIPQFVAYTATLMTLAGGIVFGEFALFQPIQIAMFVFGCICTIFGANAIAQETARYKQVQQEDEGESFGTGSTRA